MQRILRATRNTWNGLLACTRSERAFREELVVLLIGVPVGFLVATTLWRWLTLVGALLLILIVELLNTAIEKLADRITSATEPAIGQLKDMGSAAVGLSIVLAAMIWLAALAERFGLI